MDLGLFAVYPGVLFSLTFFCKKILTHILVTGKHNFCFVEKFRVILLLLQFIPNHTIGVFVNCNNC